MKVVRDIIFWVVVILLQILLFNNLSCYGLCHPQVYLICLLAMPLTLRREWEMLIGCALGLVMDIVSNSVGIHMAACVLVMFLRQPILNSLVQNSERLTSAVSMATIREVAYIQYALILIFTHQAVVSMLSTFGFAHVGWMLLQILISATVSAVFILGYNLFQR